MSTHLNAEMASILSLHCVICFDEFDAYEQPPVVLPCGHTYVCAQCSKRLKVCMECREPLFWNPPRILAPKPQHRQAQRGYNGTRYSSLEPVNPKPVESVAPIPLPLPRNLVILALMEAGQRAMSLQRDLNLEEEQDDDDEALTRIALSLENLNGPCGTYAVREVEGLAVLPMDPLKRNQRKSNPHLDATMQAANIREPFTIEFGQTVQVVDCQDGVYRLARENGYIVASEKQLVKVGGPSDKSCELEGIYDMVAMRRQELSRQLEHVERLSAGLLDRIQFEQKSEPIRPIITSPPPSPTECKDDILSISPARAMPSAESPVPLTPGRDTHSLYSHENNLSSRTPNTIDNSDLALSSYVDENARPRSIEFGCGVSFSLAGDDLAAGVRSFDGSDGRTRLFNNNSTPPIPQSPIMQPDIGAAPAASSFDTGMVNFRTGLSGHRGLGSTKTPDRRGGQGPIRGQVRQMGEHRGIGSWVSPFSLSAMLGSKQQTETGTMQANSGGGSSSPYAMIVPNNSSSSPPAAQSNNAHSHAKKGSPSALVLQL